jgi:hypothetical protein
MRDVANIYLAQKYLPPHDRGFSRFGKLWLKTIETGFPLIFFRFAAAKFIDSGRSSNPMKFRAEIECNSKDPSREKS